MILRIASSCIIAFLISQNLKIKNGEEKDVLQMHEFVFILMYLCSNTLVDSL